ncbi:MAG: MBL fold metallo-hydrolase [Actinobacteria bacterium]|nr:MBL fold metallo-hydrolase [Actinomycetota bacterium]
MDVLEVPDLVVRAIAVGSMDNNVYLLTSRADGAQLLIDAAAEPAAIEDLLASANGDGPSPVLRYLVTTHSHHDHIGALATIAAAHPEAEVLAGAADADAITASTGVVIGRRLTDGDEVLLGAVPLRVIGLRGHTPGSVTLAHAPADGPAQLFTGDSLFPGGVGRTRNDRDFRSLFGDVTERIFHVYPDDTAVRPGHGRPTTLGAERPHLDEWAARGW